MQWNDLSKVCSKLVQKGHSNKGGTKSPNKINKQNQQTKSTNQINKQNHKQQHKQQHKLNFLP